MGLSKPYPQHMVHEKVNCSHFNYFIFHKHHPTIFVLLFSTWLFSSATTCLISRKKKKINSTEVHVFIACFIPSHPMWKILKRIKIVLFLIKLYHYSPFNHAVINKWTWGEKRIKKGNYESNWERRRKEIKNNDK